MKAVILALVLTVAGSAPAPSYEEYYRDPRSNMAVLSEGQAPVFDYYRESRPQFQYVSPCAAAAAAASASAPVPAIASPFRYGYQYPQYRTEDSQEILGYSDEHFPLARYSYAPSPHVYPTASSTTGPVFGVFPGGNTGGCNVPLLFSCTPNVVTGHVVQAQPHYPASANPVSSGHPPSYLAASYPSAATPDVYRGVEPHHDSHEKHGEAASHEQIPVNQKSHEHK